MTTQTISVALCTYNGILYLQEQLESIAFQSRLPDELVVCDDGSVDGSLEVLRQFCLNSRFPVRIVENSSKLGTVKNFELAIRTCNSDLIVLADQDDVWLPFKLEQIEQQFVRPEITAVFSDAEVVDASLNSLGYTLWQRVGFNTNEQSHMASGGSLNILLRHMVVMGAAMAFRARIRPMLLPIPLDWNHDAWIALIAANTGSILPIRLPLLLYRQHSGNQVGGRKTTMLQQIKHALAVNRQKYYRNEIAKWQLLLERLMQFSLLGKECIARKIDHLQVRANLPGSRLKRIPGVLRVLFSGQYARYSRNWGSIALDIFIK